MVDTSTQDGGVRARRLGRLLDLQARIRDALRASMARAPAEVLSRAARDESQGDTIFGIDVDAEAILLESCAEWAKDERFVLIAEGVEPAGGRVFGASDSGGGESGGGDGGCAFRLIVDPIDGSRGLMYDKRSAWSLAAIAPDRGSRTGLVDIELAVMTELPTTRQGLTDTLWAWRDGAPGGRRLDLATGAERELEIAPSRATDLRHGFATVCSFFQGGKELTARIDEDLMALALGGWNAGKAEVYSDQYISSGGQLAELALGRDRFVMDIRPLIHRALGQDSTLCARPYDLCTASIAERAGCVITDPFGRPLDAPLDTTTNLGFVGYANATLAAELMPLVRTVLERHGLLGDPPPQRPE